MARKRGTAQSPLGHTKAGAFAITDYPKSVAVGFDPTADSGQGPDNQRGSVGTFLLAPVQSTPQLVIHADATRRLGLISIPPYLGWVQLFPRVVLADGSTPPDDALPLRTGYFNGSVPLPAVNDTAAIETWLTTQATPIHTHYSVTLESTTDFIFGTPFSEVAPVFLPAGTNVAVFSGLTTDLAYAGDVNCYLTAIGAPPNEQLLSPSS